jgi:hypothetical protein
MDLFFNFIWFLIQVIAITSIITLVSVYIQYRRETKRLAQELINTVSDITHIVKVEQHGDTLYWFDQDSDAFLGQGKTVDECISHIKSRYPKHLFFFLETNTLLRAPLWKLEKFNVTT